MKRIFKKIVKLFLSRPVETPVESSGCWCLDEMNMASTNTLAESNPLLDCVGHINIPGRGKVKII